MIVKGKVVKQTFHVTNTPVALKAWTCSLCGEPVEIGKRYVRYTWRKRYEIDDLPFHPVCWSIVRYYCDTMNTNLFSLEDINAWLKEQDICKSCKRHGCHKRNCRKVQKLVKHTPLLTFYDKLA